MTQEPGLAVDLVLGDDSDPTLLDEVTRELRQQLLDLDVDSVDLVLPDPTDASSVGTKGLPLLAIGSLLIRIGSSAALKNVIEGIRLWVSRQAGRSAHLTYGELSIDVKGISKGDQERLISDFLARVNEIYPASG